MEILEQFHQKISERSKTYIGYPVATDYDYSELYPLMQYSINNVGDPFIESYDMHCKSFEREVVSFYAEFFNAPANNHWGYVTNGGSEGNLTHSILPGNFIQTESFTTARPPTTAFKRIFTC